MKSTAPYNRIEHFLLWTFGLVVWAFIIWRAKHLSVTYDEVWVETIAKDSIWDIMFHPRNFTSANNHILNTLLAKGALCISDTGLFIARLPNVLSFLIYFAGVKYMARQVSSYPWLRWCMIVISCSMPFVLDFFSLSRGYGLAISFQAVSMAFAYAYIHKSRKGFQMGAYALAFLAVWANFTWLNYYLALWLSLMLCSWYANREYLKQIGNFCRQESIPSIIFVVMILLFAKPIQMLRGNDEFKWGSNAWIDSYHKLAANLNYNTTFVLTVITQVALFILVAYIVYKVYIEIKTTYQSVVESLFPILMLVFFIFISIAQRFVFQTMYPDGRKALMYYLLIPVFLIMVLQLSKQFSHAWLRRYSILISIVFIVHLCFTLDIMSVKEWRYDKYNAEVAGMLDSAEGKGMKVSWELGSSMDYYARKKTKLKPIHTIDENTPEALYYYVSESDVNKIPGKSLYIKGFDNGYTLWRKD